MSSSESVSIKEKRLIIRKDCPFLFEPVDPVGARWLSHQSGDISLK